MKTPDSKLIYALDFDGVICDSAIETAITGWKAAQTLWADMLSLDISDKQIEQFRAVRPLIETGYEAILIMRLLQTGVSVDAFCQSYERHIADLIEANRLDTTMLKSLFGETRDRWIREDETSWLDKNPLFAGMSEKLSTLSNRIWYIITTKQERFVKRILKGSGIELADDCIFGMDRQLSKQQVLQQLLDQHPKQSIVFVEDRLPTLLGIINNQALEPINLQLVDWGYNTPIDREIAVNNDIELIDLAHFLS